jgi:hypothetical protein
MKTSDGKTHTPEEIQRAREIVADDWAENARAIRREDPYASHVTEAEKDAYLAEGLAYAESVRQGTAKGSFTLWQRLNEVLTGECVALLP